MKLLDAFHNAILTHDDSEIVHSIKPHPRLDPSQQFAVYADGYRIRLIHAIKSDYPVLLQRIGHNVFDTYAGQYIEENPPKSYNLDLYPHKFALFFSEKNEGSFDSELAVLEAAIAEVFMLPDSDAFSPHQMRDILPESFGTMTLKFRIACHLLQFTYPTSEWLTRARSSDMDDLPAIPSPQTNWLLLVRHNNEVHRHNLSEQAFTLLRNLADGKCISDALEATLNRYESDAEYIISNLQKWFINWVENGVFQA